MTNLNDVINLLEKSHLEKGDYFDSTVFYYLAGAFPDLTIARCAEVVDIMRQRFIGI